jgi:hypothetical protein
MSNERIREELGKLCAGGTSAELLTDGTRELVLYRNVPTNGAQFGLPATTDVVVPVPPGYPASMIDLAALPTDSPFLARVKGGTNPQGIISLDGRQWQLASYHPHQNGGAGPWNFQRHGFHTYLDQLIAWLHRLD